MCRNACARAAATFTCAGRLSWGLQLQHQSATLHSNAVATLVFHSNGTRPSSNGRDCWPRRRLNNASVQSCSRSSTAATHGQALLLHAASSADAEKVGGGEAAIQEAMCCEKREGDKVRKGNRGATGASSGARAGASEGEGGAPAAAGDVQRALKGGRADART